MKGRYAYQCPGCFSITGFPDPSRDYECDCGERLTRIDLRDSEPVAKLRRTLDFVMPAAKKALTPDGSHNALPDGYCPDCGGGCLRFDPEPIPYVGPDPFAAPDASR